MRELEGRQPMMKRQCSSNKSAGAVLVLASAWLGLGQPGVANAQDHHYVLSNGRHVRLHESANELGVVLHRAHAGPTCAQRLAASGLGVLEDFNGEPLCRVKILRGTDTSIERRRLVLQDSAVAEVHRVFHFEGVSSPVVTTGTLVVKVDPNVSDERRKQLWSDFGVVVLEAIEDQPDVYLLEPELESADEVLAAQRLAEDPRTLWAHPNLRRWIQRRQIVPADAFFARQWHLNNTGQFGGTPGADIDALEAWIIAEGQDVLIGMFDDACDVDHVDLRDGYIGEGHDPSLPTNADGFDDPRPKQIFDNHGTRVMGLAVARANALGGRGVAFQARFTVSRGLSAGLTEAEIASVFRFARQQDVDVHINSWGLDGPNPAIVEDEIALAFNSGRNKGDLDDDGNDDRLGMVIVFATGNENVRNMPGFELSTLPQVIAVGASTDLDVRSSFSNFGSSLNFLAPGGDSDSAGLFTTDNTDREGASDPGANIGGINIEFEGGLTEPDSTGQYTAFFGGTSAACPVAAGVAALVLSVNPLLTATDVRLIMEHTCDKIDPVGAQYDTITDHSETYGYGRINARAAAAASQISLSNGGRTWPDRPTNVSANAEQAQIRWLQNVGTDEFLVVQSDNSFEFIPEDGKCYGAAQLGCGSAPIEALPAGVQVLATGCRLTCTADDLPLCDCNTEQCVEFLLPAGRKFFAIYARSSGGRYSFGVGLDSDGNVRGEATLIDRDHPSCEETGDNGNGGSTGGGTVAPAEGPALTIEASVTEGDSPLTVQFKGNAISALPIDDSRTAWDFDTSDGILVDAFTRNASHVYEAPPGQTVTFIARLTMFDTAGNPGSAQVAIRVDGPPVQGTEGITSSDVEIIVSLPGNPGSSVSQGTSPFEVQLRIDAGTLQGSGSLQSVTVNWDLGDGERASGLSVLHTYINESDAAIRIPITATISLTTVGGTTASSVATKLITVDPGAVSGTIEQPRLPGTGAQGEGGPATPCGAMGLIPLTVMMTSLMLLRRKRT